MTEDIGSLFSPLVQVKSKFTGSGVWLNLGVNDHSYVLTAQHNIGDDLLEVYNSLGKKLDATYIGPLDNLDICLIKINSKCDNAIELYLDNSFDSKSDSKCWILGHPKSLVKTSEHKAMVHAGSILIDHEDIFFRIDEEFPHDSDRDYIDGFSGGPIFEVNLGVIYLQGIITDSFDENFSYKRILGIKSCEIYNALPEEVRNEIHCKEYLQKFIDPSLEILNGKVGEYLIEGDFSEKLESIDLNDLRNCKYFYLPDDKPKETQHIALLRNNEAIKSYIHSRILSMIMDENLTNICLNPTKFENDKLFTIYITNFTETHKLIAKLITQESSLDYSNATILIIYSNNNNDLTFVTKRRISRIIANYAEGIEPELYSDKVPFKERKLLRDFLETRKTAGMKFAILNIKFLIEMVLQHVENNLYGEKYDKDIIKGEIIGVLRKYE